MDQSHENQLTPGQGLPAPVCSAPNVIWLQFHGDSDPVEWTDEEPVGVTWCDEKIFEHDVEYVRADEVRRLLAGHRCSELLGHDGLIAATMRAFTAEESNGKEFQPRFRNWIRVCGSGGANHEFISWVKARWREWWATQGVTNYSSINRPHAGPQEHAAFDRWLDGYPQNQ